MPIRIKEHRYLPPASGGFLTSPAQKQARVRDIEDGQPLPPRSEVVDANTPVYEWKSEEENA